MKDIRYIPHYNQDKGCWEVEFPNRATEEGDLLYVVCEYLWTSLYYPYNTDETKGEEYLMISDFSQRQKDMLLAGGLLNFTSGNK